MLHLSFAEGIWLVIMIDRMSHYNLVTTTKFMDKRMCAYISSKNKKYENMEWIAIQKTWITIFFTRYQYLISDKMIFRMSQFALCQWNSKLPSKKRSLSVRAGHVHGFRGICMLFQVRQHCHALFCSLTCLLQHYAVSVPLCRSVD